MQGSPTRYRTAREESRSSSTAARGGAREKPWSAPGTDRASYGSGAGAAQRQRRNSRGAGQEQQRSSGEGAGVSRVRKQRERVETAPSPPIPGELPARSRQDRGGTWRTTRESPEKDPRKVRRFSSHTLDGGPGGLYFASHNSLPFVLKRLVSGLHQTLAEALKQRDSTKNRIAPPKTK